MTKRRRARNREYTFVSVFFVAIFLSLIGYLVYFNAVRSEDFINSPYNTRQDTFSDRVIRGKILSGDGQVLAQTNVWEDGSEERYYPYSNIFAHVIGYDSNGKSGLESEANFSLLSSHSFFLDQMKNQFLGRKNMGDTVVSTLSASLQNTAYSALGNRRGAVIVLEPSTGRILAEVSKPDFDPNTISQNWDYLIQDENDSSLLNRATNGAYPPGSTFKIVTALDYFRTKGTLEGFSYVCEGSVTADDFTIHCYKGAVHGQEDLYGAFASSCNCAFAQIGLFLGSDSLRDTAEELLFNKALPLDTYRKSSFTLSKRDDDPMIMQTAIGQGKTLVSPMHMALIASAVANGGILMKPYLIDQIQNDSGDLVKKTTGTVYKRLMSTNEANLIGKMMERAVTSGSASALSGRGYTAAGKTGSAEYNEQGDSHSWFIGYSNVDDPDIAVAVIVEGGGAGSEAAVPIAGQIFDAYYYS
ncbi:MAG: penicillin-binding transpeptidase domain-containing protein [Eubacteriales bacterium]|nr:penicillin-binding transpeptidase domain-containing protein [Eubacteriales bacterium]